MVIVIVTANSSIVNCAEHSFGGKQLRANHNFVSFHFTTTPLV